MVVRRHPKLHASVDLLMPDVGKIQPDENAAEGKGASHLKTLRYCELSVLRVSYEHMGLRVCEHHQVSIDLAISSVLSELEGISSLKDEKRADLEYLRSGAC